jgi:lipase chaperone LimK
MNMLIKMQLRYFSRDTAVKLFDKKNKTTHYLNSIRIISMDKTLSNIEKKARLSKISNDYKRSLSQR